MRKYLSLLLLVAVLPACGDSSDGETFQMGSLMPLTGRFDFLVQSFTGASDVARNEINAAGGLLGRPLEIVLGDDGSGADEALVRSEVERFKAAGIEASLVATSGGALFATTAAIDNTMLLMSGTAGSGALSAETADLFFRTITTGADVGLATAAYMDREGIETLAMLGVNDPLYDSFIPGQVTAMEDIGINVVVNERYDFDADTFDPTDLLNMVYNADPDALWIGAYAEDATAILSALDRVQFSGRLFGGTGLQQAQLVDTVGSAKVEGLEVFTSFQPSGPAFDRFAADYLATNGTEANFFAITQAGMYDATAVLALAIAAAGTNDALAIRDQLRNVGSPPGAVIEAGQLATGLQMIAMGMDINYEGMASSADFDAQGDVETAYGVWQFASGELSFLVPLIEGIDY